MNSSQRIVQKHLRKTLYVTDLTVDSSETRKLTVGGQSTVERWTVNSCGTGKSTVEGKTIQGNRRLTWVDSRPDFKLSRFSTTVYS